MSREIYIVFYVMGERNFLKHKGKKTIIFKNIKDKNGLSTFTKFCISGSNKFGNIEHDNKAFFSITFGIKNYLIC